MGWLKSTRHGCEESLIGSYGEFFSLAAKPRSHTPPTPKHLSTPSPNPPETRYTLDSHPRPAVGLHFLERQNASYASRYLPQAYTSRPAWMLIAYTPPE